LPNHFDLLMSSMRLTAACLALLASLAACGGGSDDSAAPDPITQTLSVSVSGSGAVSSSSGTIQCGNGGNACSTQIPKRSDVTLTATAAAGHAFRAWGGACSGTAPTCTVGMNESRQVIAHFVATGAPARAWGMAALLTQSRDFNGVYPSPGRTTTGHL
jgi:Divergent InlB B-repeat domain